MYDRLRGHHFINNNYLILNLRYELYIYIYLDKLLKGGVEGRKEKIDKNYYDIIKW